MRDRQQTRRMGVTAMARFSMATLLGEEQPSPIDQRLARIEAQLQALARRNEEILAYLAARANRAADAASAYLGDNTAVTFLETGQRILVDTRSLDIGVHLLTLGMWEPQYTALFRRLVRPGDTVLDLGANHGVYTLIAAQLAGPAGRVHAFEPNPRLAHLAEMSARLNGYGDTVTMHRVCASDSEGSTWLVFETAFSGGGTQNRTGVEGETALACRTAILDEIFADPGFKVDVVKLDVEGSEGRALRGMRALLARSPDVRILMEFAPAMLAGSGVPAAEVVEMLESLGLSPWTVGEGGALHPARWADLAAMQDGLQNILVAREAPP